MKREKGDAPRTFKKSAGRIQKGAGFTLIELMVVIVIIGVLSAVALPRFMTQQRKAKEGAAWADLDSMTTGCEMYYLDCDKYPSGGGATSRITSSTTLGLTSLTTNAETETNWAGPYMKFRRSTLDWPLDPWDQPYEYQAAASPASSYTIWCLGKHPDAVDYSAKYVNPGEFKSP